jgi:hypothetical protein
MKTHSNLRGDSLLTLLSLLLLHVGTCQAQSSSSFFAIPVSVFVIVATLMCICFWVCFCVQLAKRRQFYGTGATANVHYAPYVHNQRPYYGSPGAAQPGSYPVQGYVPPSTVTSAGVNPPQTQQAYPGQGYATAAVPNPSPLAPPGGGTSEPVSLPEATLHQGDAPPGYAEAIGMKTVDIAGQDEQQV